MKQWSNWLPGSTFGMPRSKPSKMVFKFALRAATPSSSSFGGRWQATKHREVS